MALPLQDKHTQETLLDGNQTSHCKSLVSYHSQTKFSPVLNNRPPSIAIPTKEPCERTTNTAAPQTRPDDAVSVLRALFVP